MYTNNFYGGNGIVGAQVHAMSTCTCTCTCFYHFVLTRTFVHRYPLVLVLHWLSNTTINKIFVFVLMVTGQPIKDRYDHTNFR